MRDTSGGDVGETSITRLGLRELLLVLEGDGLLACGETVD